MLEVIRGSLWEYVGEQVKYRGSKHLVLTIGQSAQSEGSQWAKSEVITWSKTPSVSWLGDKGDFLKNFKPTTGTFSFI
jgi:hypothetical protein